MKIKLTKWGGFFFEYFEREIYWRVACKTRNIFKNKLIISKYKLIVAKTYSSADNFSIIICVSYKINKLNKKAPAHENNSSSADD